MPWGWRWQIFLEIEAREAAEFAISASGRDAAVVGSLERNLMLSTYRDLAPNGPALQLTVRNEIPLGMGCGSSAAALVAGVMLANHFGCLGWTEQQMLEEACAREGHPDNVAASVRGGFTVSALDGRTVRTATFGASTELEAVAGASASVAGDLGGACSAACELQPARCGGECAGDRRCWWLRLRRGGRSCWRPARGTGCTNRTGVGRARCSRGCCRWRGSRGYTP